MEPNQNVETEEMVTESLVEEVSIDGMCGVY
ncbi:MULTISPECIES: mycofactocin precursor MftA [Mycolicibacterium]|jgi:mycofactocin precursor|nr:MULTISPECIES: mycofactocin precursor MftA [Mycolicibacterium]